MARLKTHFLHSIVVISVVFLLLVLFSLRDRQELEDEEVELHNVSSQDKLIDLNFSYAKFNQVCGPKDDILAVILVTSYVGNVETRSAMRRIFSTADLAALKMRRIFLLALKPSSDKYSPTENQLRDENDRFKDLVQGNFVESYRNLTYKHLMGYKYATETCRSAQFVVKMDDDIVVDVLRLRSLLLSAKVKRSDRYISGYVLRGMVPVREPASKWFVPKEEYPAPIYPNFVSGWLYITTPKTSLSILEESTRSPYFWIDDVLLTGILAKRLRIRHIPINDLFTVQPEFLECCIRDVKRYNFTCEFMVGPNGGDNNLFFKFNDGLKPCYESSACIERPWSKQLNRTCVAKVKIPLQKGQAMVADFRMF